MTLSDIAHRFSGLRLFPVAAVTGLVILGACSQEKTDVVHRETDGELVPTMITRDVVTMISDSGITRYRITTPLWLVYDESKEPKWRFPESLFLEKFDNNFNTDATIRCDSATYYRDKSLWELNGNVRILNVQNEKFLTNQIFWDQRNHKVYSDSFIHIERSDRIIEGYGFESNEKMTTYTVTRPSGIFPVSDFRGGARDSSATDSVTVEPEPEAAPASEKKAADEQPVQSRPPKRAIDGKSLPSRPAPVNRIDREGQLKLKKDLK